jgi:hypothetical protein
MSEYQYYEFRTIHRRLSAEARAKMHMLSSRVQVDSHSARFVYHYGNFRGNETQELADHFDMLLYNSNFGTRSVKFAFPRSAVNPDTFEPYITEDDGIMVETLGDKVILELIVHDQSGDWDYSDEYEDTLAELVPLYDQIMSGDLRAVYLVALDSMLRQIDLYEDDMTEPPMPPNLKMPNGTINTLLAFMQIDQDMLAAAAEASPSAKSADLSDYIAQLEVAELRGFVARLLRDDGALKHDVLQRLRALAPAAAATNAPPPRTLLAIRDGIGSARKARQQQEAEAARAKQDAHLRQIEQQQAALWASLPPLLAQKKGSAYDQATAILKDLHALAKARGTRKTFDAQLQALLATTTSLAFTNRLKTANIL